MPERIYKRRYSHKSFTRQRVQILIVYGIAGIVRKKCGFNDDNECILVYIHAFNYTLCIMPKTLIFQESYLLSGIMCFNGCGNIIQTALNNCISECIENKIMPADAWLIVDAEPRGLGIHQLTVSIETETDNFHVEHPLESLLSEKIQEAIPFDILDKGQQDTQDNNKHRINILINLVSIGLLLILAIVFPPSLFLTIGLTTLSFVSTAISARAHLYAFFQNIRTRTLANMATTVSLGWVLSMAHTMFHAFGMSMASSAPMLFVMPNLLIACINAMDELKRLALERSKKIQLSGIKTLFPEMAESYTCYKLPSKLSARVSEAIDAGVFISEEDKACLQGLFEEEPAIEERRNLLKKGMIIHIKVGECFPLDSVLMDTNTVIDASLLTGEPHQTKKTGERIPAGAVNLGQPVHVYAVKNAFNSTVNELLFRSNRAGESLPMAQSSSKFTYLYTALILLGLTGALLAPVLLGIASFSLLMLNVMGILFFVCPCAIAIAHQLPKLINRHHRSKKGIHLRDERLLTPQRENIDTVVFDKTGTLTTGKSIVESSDIPASSSLWQRIYLLEKAWGRGHPLAIAIQNHYETTINSPVLFDEVKDCNMDHKHRGLSAMVQGKILHIGNVDYLKDNSINVPVFGKSKIEQGFSVVCVAEDGIYKGVIYIKHEIRHGVLEALTRLKNEGKRIIMLTGDNPLSAHGFNQQMNAIFDEKDVHAGQTPKDKEVFLKNILTDDNINPKGVWFVGDGLNDAPCCRMVSEKGGISCAMEAGDKSAFFTDISLDGSLDYMFQHHSLNHELKQNIRQNKGIIIYSTLAYFAFIITFSVVGIALPPFIPMALMLSANLFILFNAYRSQLSVEVTLNKNTSLLKKILSSNVSVALLLCVGTLLIVGILAATIATGGLTLPVIAFTSGVALALSSACTLAAFGLFSLFIGCLSTSLVITEEAEHPHETSSNLEVADKRSSDLQEYAVQCQKSIEFFSKGWHKENSAYKNDDSIDEQGFKTEP